MYKRQEFTVSGILYDRDEYTIEASYVVFGSQDFYNERVAEGDRQYNIYFTLSDSANVSMNNVAPVSYTHLYNEKDYKLLFYI